MLVQTTAGTSHLIRVKLRRTSRCFREDKQIENIYIYIHKSAEDWAFVFVDCVSIQKRLSGNWQNESRGCSSVDRRQSGSEEKC